MHLEQFHDPSGVEAQLRCHEGRFCTLDVSLPWSVREGPRPAAVLEVLWQPREAGTGLPRGVPLRLLREPLRLVPMPGQRRAIGRSRLPGVKPTLAPDCYYRIRSGGE